jgi:protocatechuate 3,4-dioxygenase beta subunit
MKTGWISAALTAVALSAGIAAQVAPPPIPPTPPVPTTIQQPPGTRPVQGRGNQPPVKPFVTTGLILGRVVDASTGRPVSGAVVSLSGGPSRVQGPAVPGQPAAPPATPPQLLVDSEGRFAFRQLARGSYGLQATKPGYSAGAYARNRPNGPNRTLQLDDGEKVVDVTLKVFKYGSISGTVTDDAGEPVVGAAVRLYRRNLVAGRRVLSQVNQATTDDRGVYRMSSLMAADYYVMLPIVPSSAPAALSTGAAARMNTDATSGNLTFSAASPGTGGRQLSADGTFLLSTNSGAGVAVPDPAARGKWRSYATQWYPSSTTAANAQPVSLAVGEDRGGIDFGMGYLPTSSISGQLMGPEGPGSQYILRLIPNDTGEWTGEPEAAVATTDPNGMFQFLTIPAGSYALQTVRIAQQREDAVGATFEDPLLFATMPISVGSDDVTGLLVTLQQGFRLSGRFEFAGSRARPTPSQFQIPVMLESADGRPSTQGGSPVRPTQDGRFTTQSQLPGRYFVRTGGAPGGWMLQSISVNGVDATETPVEITQNITGVVVTFTDQISDLRGTVKATAAGDDPPAVIVFPSDSAAWKNFGVNPLRMRRTLANAAGNFSLGSLPAGDYCVIAVPEEFSSDWQDPAFLEVLSRTAMRFTLSPGERRTVDLSVQDVRPPGIGRQPAWEVPPESGAEGSGPFVADAVPPQQTRDSKPIASQPSGAGSISGVVMQDDGTSRPARLARVSIRGSAINGERVALSGDDGVFVVDYLPPGSYQVYVTKPAYLPMFYGATRPARGPGTNVVVDGRKPVTGLKITLTRGAVVTGTVFDVEGQPAPNVRVQMMTVQTVDGERVFSTVAVSGSTLTDDRGMFRVYGVRSGTYVAVANPQTTTSGEVRQMSDQEMRAAIAEAATGIKAAAMPVDRVISPGPSGALPASVLPGRAVSYSPVFYPGTVSEQDASTFVVTAGQETGNINIPITLVPAARIDGVVIGVEGQPMTSTPQVSLQRISSYSQSTQTIRTFDGGRFQAVGVAPGAYVLSVRYTAPITRPPGGGSPAPATTLWAREEIFVNGVDLSNISLQLRPPITITGVVAIEGGARPKDVQLRLDQVMRAGQVQTSTSTRADAEGVFRFTNVTPGRYRLGATVISPAPATTPGAAAGVSPGQLAWAVKSAVLEGRDAWEGYVDITADRLALNADVTLTTKLPEVSGQVLTQSGAPVTDMAVVLFAVDRKYWGGGAPRRVRSLSRVTPEGSFRFTGLMPGEYCLAVLMDLDAADMQDPVFLEQLLPAGLKLTVTEGERKVQNVRLAGR